MRQLFDIASALLDETTKINRAWHIREDQVSPLNIGLIKEQMENNQERDENMATIMTQMDLSTKHVMGGGYKAVNAISAKSGGNLNDTQFEAMYNGEVQFFSNQAGGSCPSYPRLGGNQGWNRDHDDGWRDRDQELHDRAINCRDRDGDKDRYVPPHERQMLKESRANPECFWTEDMHACILK
ncbi:hypothetical protein MTR67_039632 [Solanum verrucosum]|uniref:Uncharacterized protein n=1 Tax=Solanum verrucosum TaxID=315347 RepID=A0AAF0ZNR9_SOLVR|nr:hypothetical protein MTR67_039632 [Solanum verrucosum]